MHKQTPFTESYAIFGIVGVIVVLTMKGIPFAYLAISSALRGLGDLKTGKRSWFRSGTLEVRVGQPIRFAASESEAAITARLHSEVEKLLTT